LKTTLIALVLAASCGPAFAAENVFTLGGEVVDVVLVPDGAKASEADPSAPCPAGSDNFATMYLRVSTGEIVPVTCSFALACTCWATPLHSSVAISGVMGAASFGSAPEDVVPLLLAQTIRRPQITRRR